jgi:predicted permease
MHAPSLRPLVRLLWRDRAMTFVAVAILALGLGANIALFTIVNAALLRPLPYPASSRMVVVRVIYPEIADRYPSLPANAMHVEAWRRACRSCEDLASFMITNATLTGDGEPEQLEGGRVSANFFSLLGIMPVAGRTFVPDDDKAGAARTVVISNGLWVRRFGADPSVIGTAIQLNGQPTIIVGVLPASARLPGPGELGPLVVIPQRLDVFVTRPFTDDELHSEGDFDYGVIARLRDGVSLDAARAEFDAIEGDISSRLHDPTRLRALVQPLQDVVVRDARGPLLLLFAATAAVLLIVCVNLANLLLARRAARRRDEALKRALGASASHLLGESIAESLALASAGGVLGMAIAWLGKEWIASTAAASVPRLTDAAFDWRVVAFTAATTIAAGILVGVLPAVRTAVTEPADVLKAGSHTTTEGRGGARARRTLVAAQSAIGVALLVVTGLLLASFVRLMRVDKGFDTSSVLTLDVALPTLGYPASAIGKQTAFFDAAIARLRALPGVRAAGMTSRLPLTGEGSVNLLSVEHDPRPESARPIANYRFVSGGYFNAIGTPILEGRTFADTDRGHAVIVLSLTAARTLWPGLDPIGRRIDTGGFFKSPADVIGVAADVRAVDLRRSDVLFAYLPDWSRALGGGSFVIRTSSSDAAATTSAARQAIWSVDRSVPIPRVQPMADLVDRAVARQRFELTLMLLFGAAAATLAALGVYAVVSFAVTRRRREMGIRIALGASPTAIERLVVLEGLTPVAVGLAIGLAAAVPIGHAISGVLFGVRPADPMVMAAAGAVLVIAALGACAAPAYRAARRTDVTAVLK